MNIGSMIAIAVAIILPIALVVLFFIKKYKENNEE